MSKKEPGCTLVTPVAHDSYSMYNLHGEDTLTFRYMSTPISCRAIAVIRMSFFTLINILQGICATNDQTVTKQRLFVNRLTTRGSSRV